MGGKETTGHLPERLNVERGDAVQRHGRGVLGIGLHEFGALGVDVTNRSL